MAVRLYPAVRDEVRPVPCPDPEVSDESALERRTQMEKQFYELSKSPVEEGISRRDALKLLGIGLGGAILASAGISAEATVAGAQGYLLISSLNTDSVLRYNE